MVSLVNFKDDLGSILSGARRLSLAVSTGDAMPQVSLMQFVVGSECRIFMKFFSSSRKFSVLKENKSAAICVYDNPKYTQMEGTVDFIDSVEVIDAVKNLFLEKYGDSEQMKLYLADKSLVFVEFVPKAAKCRLRESYPFGSKVLF